MTDGGQVQHKEDSVRLHARTVFDGPCHGVAGILRQSLCICFLGGGGGGREFGQIHDNDLIVLGQGTNVTALTANNDRGIVGG